MSNARIRLDLLEAEPSRPDERRWTLLVDGADAGVLRARRDGPLVRLSVTVTERQRGLGVGHSAVGRVLGLAPFAEDVVPAETLYVLDAANDPDLETIGTATGFARDDDADGAWTRRAPRTRPAADDITRFLDAGGRIHQYPHRADDRHALLTWVVDHAMREGEVLDERELGERLEPFAPASDVAALRRHLVDHGLLERTRTGSQYARAAGGTDGAPSPDAPDGTPE
jgi:hypothetical protein